MASMEKELQIGGGGWHELNNYGSIFFFPAQNENALAGQKSQLSAQRSFEPTGAFISAGV